MNSKILIAQEDPAARPTLETTLGAWKYEALTVGSGLEAWEILQREGAPRLVILDWRLPGMDGVEVCRMVRRRAQEPYTYILLLATKEQKQEILQGVEAGADDYLLKPFTPDELKIRLRAGQRILDLQSELMTARAVLRRQVTRDTLTGLWNRTAILDLLRREVERARREAAFVGLAMVNLDHLTHIRDTYGQLTGEAMLREIGHRLRRSMRPYDGLGRYGEATFLIIAPGCDASTMVGLAERLRAGIGSQGLAISEGTLPCTITLGVFSSSAAPEAPAEALVGATEAALQRARAGGGHRVELATWADLSELSARELHPIGLH